MSLPPDPDKPRALSRKEIDQLFQVVEKAPMQKSEPDAIYQEVAARAAVVGAFQPSQIVEGLPESDALRGAVDRVLDGSVIVRQGSRRRWILAPQLRSAALERLGARAASVLDSLKARPDDMLSRALNGLIRETVPEASKLETPLLRTLVNAAQWCQSASKLAVSGLPAWNQELKRRELLDPLRELVGPGFIGRERDLETLRKHVDVVPPSGTFEGWQRWLARKTGWGSHRILVVHGPGGSGKSTLMAHFILEHAAVAGERAFPFVYLDFDRAEIDPLNPLSFVLEAVRQLEAQFPEAAGKLDSLKHGASEDGRVAEIEERAANALTAGAVDMARGGLQHAASLIGVLRAASLAERPFLLVLDTFEEVQERGEDAVESVFDWLEALSELESLRVVVSGRAPVEDSNRDVANHALRNLSSTDAVKLLKLYDVPAKLAERVYKAVGGNPLCLRLAVQLIRQHEFEKLLKSKELEGSFWAKLDEVQIQGVLYGRLLRRVKHEDKRVEKLAHPGLVLRRITPDIIANVLAPVLDLKVASASDAKALYEGLRKQITLVREERGALVHRKDVRRVMLDLQRKKDETIFRKLNEAAAYYYRTMSAEPWPVAEREAVYHELMTGAEPFHVLADCSMGAVRDLRTAGEELPDGAATAIKVLLGHPIPAPQAGKLTRDAWLPYAYQRSIRLLGVGEPEAAIELLEERDEGGSSAVSYPRALALFQALQWDEADVALAKATELKERNVPALLAKVADRGDLLVRPWIERAWLRFYSRGGKEAREYFSEGAKRAEKLDNDILRIEAWLGTLVAGGGRSEDGSTRRAPLYLRFHGALTQVTPEQWRANMPTLRRVVFLGYADELTVRLALRLLGLRLRSQKPIEQFRREFYSELSSSQRDGLEDSVRALHGLKAKDLEATLSLSTRLARQEIDLATSLDRPELRDLARRVQPFLRGRFAAWRLPIRTAVLLSFPDERIKPFFEKTLPQVHREAAVKNVRDLRGWVDAAIAVADDHNELLDVVSHCVKHAESRKGMRRVSELLKALERYAEVGPPPAP
jgi:hypothetical protein